jgi:hypothetical protein
MPETKEHVIQTVKDALDHHKPKRIHASLREDAVFEEHGVWQVPLVVRPNGNIYGLYDKLAGIEIELEDELGLKVFLLPAYR